MVESMVRFLCKEHFSRESCRILMFVVKVTRVWITIRSPLVDVSMFAVGDPGPAYRKSLSFIPLPGR